MERTEEKLFSREEFYDLVWSKPGTTLAKELGISDTMIKNHCRKHKIPRPDPGYWAKVKYGKRVKKPKLPKINAEPVICIRPQLNDPMRKAEESKKLPFKIEIPSQLDDAHPLAQRSHKSFNAAKAGDRQILHPGWSKAFDLRITKGTVLRAHLILSALLTIFEKLGYPVEVNPKERRKTSVTVDGEKLYFHIDERIKRIDYQLTEKEKRTKEQGGYVWSPRWDFVPSSELSLWNGSAYSYRFNIRQKFSDGKRQTVENLLEKFILTLQETATAHKVQRKKDEEAERVRELERLEDERLLGLRKEELERRRKLYSLMRNWQKAEKVRAFIDVSLKSDTDKGWLEWIKGYADQLDPFIESTPDIVQLTENLVRYRRHWY
jgi:hypothetical protein